MNKKKHSMLKTTRSTPKKYLLTSIYTPMNEYANDFKQTFNI